MNPEELPGHWKRRTGIKPKPHENWGYPARRSIKKSGNTISPGLCPTRGIYTSVNVGSCFICLCFHLQFLRDSPDLSYLPDFASLLNFALFASKVLSLFTTPQYNPKGCILLACPLLVPTGKHELNTATIAQNRRDNHIRRRSGSTSSHRALLISRG